MKPAEKLKEISKQCKHRLTNGLEDSQVSKFLAVDSDLVSVIDEAYEEFIRLRQSGQMENMNSEREQIAEVQEDFVNFYDPFSVNPYISLAARGPWIITTCGAVIHDSGGYGMLGLGHGPREVLAAMNTNHVMANIMTANYEQKRFTTLLNKEIGYSRDSGAVYAKYMCLNSGSEAMSVASRISDLNAKKLCSKGSRHFGKKLKFLALAGGFHGRTDRPAQISDSCLASYKEHLASFVARDNLETVKPNDLKALKAAFAKADADGVFFEAMFIEPVMGEGNPGLSISPEFYQQARTLCENMGSLFIVDSIQAGLRANGCLSIVDYPSFRKLDPPDIEVFSKALNAGQYPLSVLAVNAKFARMYVTGMYGNTMTSNPRALAVASAVLTQINSELRENIVAKGQEFLEKLEVLAKKYPNVIKAVQGTGLLFCVEMDSRQVKVVGREGLEVQLRKRGIGVIHGGQNALRFTPHFRITSSEIDLIVATLDSVLQLCQNSAPT